MSAHLRLIRVSLVLIIPFLPPFYLLFNPFLLLFYNLFTSLVAPIQFPSSPHLGVSGGSPGGGRGERGAKGCAKGAS